MGTVWIFILAVIVGIAVGYALPASYLKKIKIPTIQLIILCVLMLIMGAKLATDDRLFEYAAIVGLQAFALCIASIAGSVLAILLVEKMIFSNNRIDIYYDEVEMQSSPTWVMPVTVFICIIIGISTVRLFSALREFIVPHLDTQVTIWLSILVFTAGLDVGRRKNLIGDVKRSGWGLILLPIATVLGSCIMAAIVAPIIGIKVLEGGSVGSACGWYTLAGVMLSKITPRLGALAFLTNMMRELISIFITPFVAKKFGPFAAVAPAGATAMDTLLPIIIRSTSPANTIIAFSNGFLMTFIVPVMLSFFTNLLS